MKRIWFFLLMSISLTSVLFAQDFRVDYPLDTCIVTGKKFGNHGTSVVYDYHGREIRFCRSSCIAKFEKNPKRYLKKLDKKIIAQQLPYYPLKNCIVSGEPLGKMGAAKDFVYKNRLFRFCCGGCIRRLKENPKRYFANLDKAVIATQKASYPLRTCVVSGKKLIEGKSVDLVYANRLVRLYCPKCVEKFWKNPVRYLKIIDRARSNK